LKEQVAAVAPQLEELRQKREDRAKQFVDVKSQIQKIVSEIAGNTVAADAGLFSDSDEDLTLRRLDEYHAQLQTLQKEKVCVMSTFSDYSNA
jgi:protein regulator of cytokinesis 1